MVKSSEISEIHPSKDDDSKLKSNIRILTITGIKP